MGQVSLFFANSSVFRERMYRGCFTKHGLLCMTPELDMDWIHPWIELDWVRLRQDFQGTMLIGLDCVFGWDNNDPAF